MFSFKRFLVAAAFSIVCSTAALAGNPVDDTCAFLQNACGIQQLFGGRASSACARATQHCATVQGIVQQAQQVQQVDCGELRRACLYRDQLGERGQGNCRTYRRYCKNGR